MISVIIPVYNAEQYLSKMLDSIIVQSYTEFEIILVNDGSTDNSSAVCHNYADKYDFITVFDNQNKGVSASRNFGLEKAKGEFIWFMDSDDILEKDAFLCAVKAQQKHDADVVIGGMNFCFIEEGKNVLKAIQEEFLLEGDKLKYKYSELFSKNYISSLWNKLIRRSVIVENNIKMNESLYMYEDYVFCMDVLLKCEKIVCLKDVFYNYQLRNTTSLSHRYKDNALGMFCIFKEKISEYMKAFNYEDASAEASLNDLLIYFAYECVKNEAKHKNCYTKIKKMLCDKTFHSSMLKYKGTTRKYRIVQMMMKNKMAFLLLIYLIINKKI